LLPVPIYHPFGVLEIDWSGETLSLAVKVMMVASRKVEEKKFDRGYFLFKAVARSHEREAWASLRLGLEPRPPSIPLHLLRVAMM
jgi:hypothetical protein